MESQRQQRREKSVTKKQKEQRKADNSESKSDHSSTDQEMEDAPKDSMSIILQAIDKLSEKRSQTRVDALNQLNTELAASYHEEVLAKIMKLWRIGSMVYCARVLRQNVLPAVNFCRSLS